MVFKTPDFGAAAGHVNQLAGDVKLTTTSLEAMGVASSKVTSAQLSGLNLTSAEYKRAQSQIAGLSVKLNLGSEALTKSFVAAHQAGVEFSEMGFSGLEEFQRVMEVTGTDSAKFAASMGKMKLKMAKDPALFKRMTGEIFAMGKANNIGREALAGMAGTIDILDANMTKLPDTWDENGVSMGQFLKGTTAVAAAFTAVGLTGDEAMKASQGLTETLVGNNTGLAAMYSGLADDFPEASKFMTEQLGNHDEAFKLLAKSPDEFMLKMGKVVETIATMKPPKANSLDRYRLGFEKTFGPASLKMMEKGGFAKMAPILEKAQDPMDAQGVAIKNLSKKYQDGRTYADRFALAQDNIQTQLKKVHRVMSDGTYLAAYNKQSKDFLKTVNHLADKGGALGKLTTSMIEIKNRGFGGFLASRSSFGFALSEAIGLIQPMLQYLPMLRTAFGALLSPIGAVAAAIGVLADLGRGKDSFIKPFIDNISKQAPVFFQKVKEVFSKVFSAVFDVIQSIDWGKVGQSIRDGLTWAFNGISKVFNMIDWGKVGDFLGDALGKVVNFAFTMAFAAVDLLGKFLDFFMGLDWGKIGNKLGQVMTGLVALSADIIVTVIKRIPELVVAFVKLGVGILSGIEDALKNAFPKWAGEIGAFFTVLKAVAIPILVALAFHFGVVAAKAVYSAMTTAAAWVKASYIEVKASMATMKAHALAGASAVKSAAFTVKGWLSSAATAVASGATQVGQYLALKAAALAHGVASVAIWARTSAAAVASRIVQMTQYAALRLAQMAQNDLLIGPVVRWAKQAIAAIAAGTTIVGQYIAMKAAALAEKLAVVGSWLAKGAALAGYLVSMLAAGAAIIGQYLGMGVAAAASAVASAASFAVMIAGYVAAGLAAAVGAAAVVGGWLAMAAAAVANAAVVAAAWLVAFFPITAILLAIAGLALVIYKFGDKIKAFFSGLWNGIKDVAKAVWDKIISIITSPIAAVKAAWGAVKGFFGGLWDGVKGAAGSAWGWIKGKVTGLWGETKKEVSSISIVDVVQKQLDEVKQKAAQIQKEVASNAKSTIQETKDASNGLGGIVSTAMDVAGRAASLANKKVSGYIGSFIEKTDGHLKKANTLAFPKLGGTELLDQIQAYKDSGKVIGQLNDQWDEFEAKRKKLAIDPKASDEQRGKAKEAVEAIEQERDRAIAAQKAIADQYQSTHDVKLDLVLSEARFGLEKIAQLKTETYGMDKVTRDILRKKIDREGKAWAEERLEIAQARQEAETDAERDNIRKKAGALDKKILEDEKRLRAEIVAIKEKGAKISQVDRAAARDQVSNAKDVFKQTSKISADRAAKESANAAIAQSEFKVSGERAVELASQLASIKPGAFKSRIVEVKRELGGFLEAMDKASQTLIKNTNANVNKFFADSKKGWVDQEDLIKTFTDKAVVHTEKYWTKVIDEATKATGSFTTLFGTIQSNLASMAQSVNVMDLLASPSQISQWAASVVSALGYAFKNGGAVDALITTSYQKALEANATLQAQSGSATPDTSDMASPALPATSAQGALLNTINKPTWAGPDGDIPKELKAMNKQLKEAVEQLHVIARTKPKSGGTLSDK
jgi:hypothetical protein